MANIIQNQLLGSKKHGTDSCSICNLERMAIADADRDKTLNIRKELATTCPHHGCMITTTLR